MECVVFIKDYLSELTVVPNWASDQLSIVNCIFITRFAVEDPDVQGKEILQALAH